ncbi:MAG: hypothetical protein QJR03_11925 [Sphaerobacter sp.]|nr:hypothetical protein [Sphaerobacter sp.]
MTAEPTLVAVVGDITAVEADAIVNAANNELWIGTQYRPAAASR